MIVFVKSPSPFIAQSANNLEKRDVFYHINCQEKSANSSTLFCQKLCKQGQEKCICPSNNEDTSRTKLGGYI